MATVWPATLPAFVLEAGYQEGLEDQTVETQMDAGPAKIRRRFTTSTRRFQVTVQMTPEQAAIFETFYLTTLSGGSLPFDWVHPRTQVAKTFRFRRPPPTVQVAGSGAIVRYSMNLETVL
ncbi:hypothetical protein UFOVP233_72 [uncultured Caudovirales phage]|uniref:Minor tail protein n=1 Tax=uncultured Caudovirales phage TaxID=2100421 RepID=A0A6J7WZI3_9CAUD|nr:hypothetical protein UFOVP233_72 [uncultured Caudovirales phage]